MEELCKVLALQVTRPGIRMRGPKLLECTHLLASNRLGPTTGCLEHVGEVLNHHTSEHVDKDVLMSRGVRSHSYYRRRTALTMLSKFQAMNKPNDQLVLPQSEVLISSGALVHRGYVRSLHIVQ